MSILPLAQPIENGLVPIYQTDEGFAVNTRELHESLGSARQYADWIKDRIKKFGFVEGIDYTLVSQICETSTGGTVRFDYIVPIDIAKELAMVENNDKGRQVRRYFIEAEKKVKSPRALTPSEFMFEQAKIMLQFERDMKAQMEKTAAIESKVEHIARAVEPIEDNWQGEIVNRIKSVCVECGLNFEHEYRLMYATLESRGKDIDRRQKFMKERLAATGATQKRIAAVSKIAVIASDPDLRAHFERIVQDWTIRSTRDFA